MSITLRPLHPDDIPTLYAHQSDRDASQMAVATPRDWPTYTAHVAKVMVDPEVHTRAILLDSVVVGQVSKFMLDGQPSVGYRIAKEYWGKGIASEALALLLQEVTLRPLHARAARSNVASIRVLEKCGFTVTHYAMSTSTERFPACEEAFLILNAHTQPE